MSFIADKKREHEAGAEKAILEKDYAKAFFHTAKAAEFGLKLAEETEGKIAARYVEDATELINIATELKAKAKSQNSEAARKAIKEAATGESSAGTTPWELREKPTEKLADVAGLEDVKQELREKVIGPFLHPEIYERFKVRIGGGILMFGPPGNGKTYIARAVAGELDAAFFNVNASQVKDKYVGETEKNLQRLFDEARAYPKVIIFLDEVDHLLAKRGNRKIGSVAQFLALTDGLVKITNCMLVLAATNKPWVLDEAVIRPGRLGTHIYVGPPDTKAREAIIALNMKGVPAAADVSFASISPMTEGYSGADVAELCDRAKRFALNRQIASGGQETVTAKDFADAIEKVKPSVTSEMLEEFKSWRDAGAKPPDADEDE